MEGGLASLVQVEGLLGITISHAVIIQFLKAWLCHTVLQQEGIVPSGTPRASSIPSPALGAVCRVCGSTWSCMKAAVEQGVSLAQVLISLGDAQLGWTERMGSRAPTCTTYPTTALPVWNLTVHQGDVVDDEGLSSQLGGTIHSGKFEQGHQQHQTLPPEPSGAEHISSGELGTSKKEPGAGPEAGVPLTL